MIELVVFDMAGTTVKDDKYVDAVFSEVLINSHTVLKQKDVDHIMGWPKPTAIKYLLQKGYKGTRRINDALVEELHKEFVDKMIKFYETSNLVQEIEGASDVFLAIKSKGAKVALDTGFSRPIADAIIKRLGWDNGLVDATVTSDEVKNGRPEPDMVFKLMSLTAVNNIKKVVKIGDTVSDILQGHNATCGLVVGVTSGTCTKKELLVHEPDYIIGSIRELPFLLWT